jgi:site-specific recombinase XerD
MNAFTTDPFLSFDAWAAKQQKADDFNDQTVEVYRSIWSVWLAWLAGRGTGWTAAGEADVRTFIEGPAQAEKGRMAISKGRMATYTRQRYWRVLRGVYAQACRDGHMERNPALEVPEQHRPHIDRRSRQSQVLPPGVLAALRDSQLLTRLLPHPSPSQWWVLRDRAAVTLLAYGALTTSELTALRGQDLRIGRAVLRANTPAPRLPGMETGAAISVDVAGEGDAVSRSVPLPAAALTHLMPWVRDRERLLGERYRHLSDAPALNNCPLFLSRQRGSDGLLPPMEVSTVYTMVKRCLTALYASGVPGIPTGSKARIAQGAAIVRNTVLRDWIDDPDIGAEEAARRAGLQSSASLRLPHQSAPVAGT